MKRVTVLLAALTTACLVPAAPGTPPPPRDWAVPTSIEFVELSPANTLRFTQLLMGAVDMAHAFAPKSPNLFDWRGPRDRTKSLRLLLANARKPGAPGSKAALEGPARSEAFVTTDARGRSSVTVILFVDRLVLNTDGTPNLDGVAHLTLELVLNVFGLVQTYLERPVITDVATDAANGPAVGPDFARAEALVFLDRLMNSVAFTVMDPAIRAGFVRVHEAFVRQPAEGCAPALWAAGHLPAPPTEH